MIIIVAHLPWANQCHKIKKNFLSLVKLGNDISKKFQIFHFILIQGKENSEKIDSDVLISLVVTTSILYNGVFFYLLQAIKTITRSPEESTSASTTKLANLTLNTREFESKPEFQRTSALPAPPSPNSTIRLAAVAKTPIKPYHATRPYTTTP